MPSVLTYWKSALHLSQLSTDEAIAFLSIQEIKIKYLCVFSIPNKDMSSYKEHILLPVASFKTFGPKYSVKSHSTLTDKTNN